jgi:hypothetical protein
LRAGGYPWRNFNGPTNDNHNWWFKWTWQGLSWNNTRSWSFASDQRGFLIADGPGGIIKGTATGNSNTSQSFFRRWPSNVGLTRAVSASIGYGDRTAARTQNLGRLR